MIGFSLLLGHLLGDYIFQNDWQAQKNQFTLIGYIACFVHCCLYTFACFLTCWWFLPYWAYPVIGLTHFPIDKWRLANFWMKNISGQSKFASPDEIFFPWSVIMVDNIFHLIVLYVIGINI